MFYPRAVLLAVPCMIPGPSRVAPRWALELPHAERTCLLSRMSQCQHSLGASQTLLCFLLPDLSMGWEK